VDEPVVIKTAWRTTTMADIVSVLPYMERISGKATRFEFDNFPLAYRGLRAAIAVASTIR
jgi:D-aminopeptidase